MEQPVLLYMLLYIVWVWLEEKDNKVNQDPNPKQPQSEYVQDSHTNFSLIELMDSQKSQEKAQQQGCPLVFWFCGHESAIHIGVCICVSIVDDYLGLSGLGLVQLLYLPAAQGAHHRVRRNLPAAVPAIFCGLLAWGILGVLLHIHPITPSVFVSLRILFER